MATLALPLSPMVCNRLAGRPLLLLLDVDGTLAPIAPRPEYAVVPPATRQVLEALVTLPYTKVAVISGRSAESAAELVCVPGAWTIGNHGLVVAEPGEPPSARADVIRFG